MMGQEIKCSLLISAVNCYAILVCLNPKKHFIIKVIAFIVSMTAMTAFCLALTGCATAKPPVILGCKLNLPQEGHYPITDLKKGDKPGTVAKAYVATVQLQHDYIQMQKRAMRGCE